MKNIFQAKIVIMFLTALLAVLVAYTLFPTVRAHANPFYTGSKAQSATATTSPTYLKGGIATSTTVYDAYEQFGTNQTSKGDTTIPDTLAWIIDGVASSTNSTISAWCEYSDNYNGTTGNGDWYQNEFLVSSSSAAGLQSIAQQNSFSFTYASSTIGGAAPTGSNNRFQKMFACPVYTRFTRLIVSNTGTFASVWVQAIPKKQRNSGN